MMRRIRKRNSSRKKGRGISRRSRKRRREMGTLDKKRWRQQKKKMKKG